MAYTLLIDSSWDDAEYTREFSTWEEAWDAAKKAAIEEAASFAYEHEDETEMRVFHGRIDLFYCAYGECAHYYVTPSLHDAEKCEVGK